MADKPNAIVLTKTELDSESQILLDTLMSISLYDSEKRRRCIAEHIDKIQRIIARRILQCGDDNANIQSSVFSDLLCQHCERS